MSGTVSFKSIPPNIRVPLFWAEFNTSQTAIGIQPQRALIIGGTITAQPSAPIFMPPPIGTGPLGAEQAAAAMFGSGSMLAGMVGYYRQNDPGTELWVLPIADPSGGGPAIASITVTGTVTASGTISLYIGGTLIQVAVSTGYTSAGVAAVIQGAIQATFTLPCTSSIISGQSTVTLTSKHTLVGMNNIDVRLNYRGAAAGEVTPSGITISITGFTGGTGVPNLSGVAAALGTMDFDFIISGYNDATSLAALTAIMSDSAGRWSYVNQLYGGVWTASIDTPNNLLTLGNSMNDRHTVIWGAEGSPTPYWKVAAAATGACVPSIIAQPNIPLQGNVIAGVLAPVANDLFGYSTNQSMLTNGIAAISWDRTGTCRVVRAITTYQFNSFGVSDASYLDVGRLYTEMQVVRRLKSLVTGKYGNVLLVQDGTPIGYGVPAVSPSIVRGSLIADFKVMENLGWVQDVAAFKAGLIVTINANDPTRLDVLYDPTLVSGLAIFAVSVQSYLTANNNDPALAAA